MGREQEVTTRDPVESCRPTGSAERSSGPTGRTRPILVQTKLSVGPAGDRYELEADAVADDVVRFLSDRVGDPGEVAADGGRVARSVLARSPSHAFDPMTVSAPRVVRRARPSGHSTANTQPSAGRVQRSASIATPDLGGEVDAGTETKIRSSLGRGRPMADEVRSEMEHAFGTGFADVRVHEGSQAAELNHRVQAKAFTVGSDVYFRDGVPDASSRSGQHLLAHELTHVVQQSGGVRRVQRVSDNLDRHQQFLEAKAAGKNYDPQAFLVAKACAFVLDHNASKQKHLDLPVEFAGVLQHVPTTGNPQDYLNLMHGFINGLGEATSQITWGPLTARGVGTGVKVVFSPGGHAAGTPTSDKTSWMTDLDHRRDGDKSLYVMGHLLNADLGGPGLDYNYVPLTGRAGWYGANDANGLHSKGIEQIVKAKGKLLGGSVTHLEYEVQAVQRVGARPAIAQLEAALVEMRNIGAQMPLGGTVLRQLGGPVKDQLKARIDGFANLDTILRSVRSKNYWTATWGGLIDLVAADIELWKLEDALVPERLETRVGWVQDGVAQELRLAVPITLPETIDAPIDSTRKSSKRQSGPQNHDQQVTDFLNRYSVAFTAGTTQAAKAIVAAILMDLNEFERADLVDLFDNLKEHAEFVAELQKTQPGTPRHTWLEQQRQQRAGVVELMASEPALARVVASQDHMKAFADMLRLPTGDLLAVVRGYVATNARPEHVGKRLSTITYEGTTPWNSPLKVTARLEKDGHPIGSSAGGDSGWMLQLEQRADDSKTLYVRGHMLNRHLGGAGLDSNMVPLTGREGWFGANDANGIHSREIEEYVKRLYEQLAGPGDQNDARKVTNLEYVVEVVMGDHKRPQTQMVAGLTDAFDQHVYNVFAQQLVEQNSQLGDQDRQTKYLGMKNTAFADELQRDPASALNRLLHKLHENNLVRFGGGDPTSEPLRGQLLNEFCGGRTDPQQLQQTWQQHVAPVDLQTDLGRVDLTLLLADADLRAKYSQPIAALDAPARQRIAETIDRIPTLAPLLDAVSPTGNYLLEDVISLRANLRANRDLWAFEDLNVPLGLRVWATWNQFGGQGTSGVKFIPNTLPSDIRAPFRTRGEDPR